MNNWLELAASFVVGMLATLLIQKMFWLSIETTSIVVLLVGCLVMFKLFLDDRREEKAWYAKHDHRSKE